VVGTQLASTSLAATGVIVYHHILVEFIIISLIHFILYIVIIIHCEA